MTTEAENIDRYELEFDLPHTGCVGMEKRTDGDYVFYDDHIKVIEAKDRLIAEKDLEIERIKHHLEPTKEEWQYLVTAKTLTLEKQLQAHKEGLRVAIEFIDEVSCVHNTLMEVRSRDKARYVKAKLNELIGGK